MIGHDYTESRAAEDLLLWHAITVGAASTPRVVRYVGDGAPAATSAVDAALGRIRIATSLVASSAEVPLRLATADVFLVDAQHDADEATLAQIGAEWSRALDTFLGRGGVVIALDAIGTAGNGGASSWMAAAGLADPVDRRDVSSSVVRVVAAADGLAIGMPLSYRASASSVEWIAPTLPVIVTADDTGGVGLHRTVLPM
jgi:hypothetical protein